jgi:hypothetical protein
VDFDEALVVSAQMDPMLVRMEDVLTQLAPFDSR